jgi:hypothetical protein
MIERYRRRTRWSLLGLLLLLAACQSPGTVNSPSPPPAAASATTPERVPTPIGSTATVAPPIPSATVVPSRTGGGITVSATATFAGYAPPYPPPASCAVALWSANERRNTFPAFWLDGAGLAAGNPVGPVLFAGGQKIQWQATPEGSGDLAVTATRLDGPASPGGVENPAKLAVGIWSTNTIFPEAGCWHVQATAGTHALDTTIYVYPAGCRPAPLRVPGSTPEPCLAPAR